SNGFAVFDGLGASAVSRRRTRADRASVLSSARRAHARILVTTKSKTWRGGQRRRVFCLSAFKSRIPFRRRGRMVHARGGALFARAGAQRNFSHTRAVGFVGTRAGRSGRVRRPRSIGHGTFGKRGRTESNRNGVGLAARRSGRVGYGVRCMGTRVSLEICRAVARTYAKHLTLA